MITAYLQVLRPRDGGRPPVIGFRMRRPGAFHHARFMAKSLYILKIAMFKDHFALTNRQRNCFVALAQFVALIYAPYYLQSSLAIAAPRLDRALWLDLLAYEPRFPAVGSF